jgi:MoxR-like ATPase
MGISLFLTNEHEEIETRGAFYIPDPQLVRAINVALILNRPLLVSGEPGCGKTSLGFAIARKLGIERIYFFSAKSDSEARSIFYVYDTIARFRDAQIGLRLSTQEPIAKGAERYITYQALGRAILDAHPSDQVSDLIKGGYRHPGTPRRSVVVIDEIDKAPRDFPNDLLDEIDRLYFRVPELVSEGFKAETPKKTDMPREFMPVIVITSNSEKQLPNAFLRRCVFHHISFPDKETLEKIALTILAADQSVAYEQNVKSAIEFFLKARPRAVEHKPGTAELLDFCQAAIAIQKQQPGIPFEHALQQSLSALIKTRDDTHRVLTSVSE